MFGGTMWRGGCGGFPAVEDVRWDDVALAVVADLQTVAEYMLKNVLRLVQ